MSESEKIPKIVQVELDEVEMAFVALSVGICISLLDNNAYKTVSGVAMLLEDSETLGQCLPSLTRKVKAMLDSHPQRKDIAP